MLCIFLYFRYECNGGGTPRLKFNSTGPIKGVIGGSYSTVSIQVRIIQEYFEALYNTPTQYLLVFAGSQSFEAFSHSTNLACVHSQSFEWQISLWNVCSNGSTRYFSSKFVSDTSLISRHLAKKLRFLRQNQNQFHVWIGRLPFLFPFYFCEKGVSKQVKKA